MLRKRVLILLGGCLLAVSTACADDLAYVDCAKQQGEATQVYAKPRRTQDTVASLACGERFTVLLYGFIFSRIETKDGKVGYIFSSLITVDHSGATAPHGQPTGSAVPPTTAPQTSVAATQPASVAPAQMNAAPVQAPPSKTAAASPEANANTVEATPSAPQKAVPVVTPAPSTTPEPAQTEAYSDPTPASSADAMKTAPQRTAAEANATPAAERTPVPAEPANPASEPPVQPAVQPANARESWERPNPTAAERTPRVEFYGGYAFTRFDDGGSGTNLQGGMGSFGWNVKPWLQIVADTSYSAISLSGTKNVLYGNHYGPRVYPRGRSRLGMRPFVEALFGGTRLSTTVSGASGYNTSENVFSIKAGGGLDMRLSRYFEVRVLDADYYRTSFGGVTQNNYWISTGVVLRLFGGGSE